MMYRSDEDPRPMHHLCCTVGGVRLSFSTEEELVAHWNMFHVAVAPQFSCQVPGCNATFPTDPGALDRYLVHIHQKLAEEKISHRARDEIHSLDALPGALSVKPNPFFKPPSSIYEVP